MAKKWQIWGSTAGDHLLGDSVCQAVGHEPAATKARGQPHPKDPAALQFAVCATLLQTGQRNTGTQSLSIYC